jgi:hypothetical protein
VCDFRLHLCGQSAANFDTRILTDETKMIADWRSIIVSGPIDREQLTVKVVTVNVAATEADTTDGFITRVRIRKC